MQLSRLQLLAAAAALACLSACGGGSSSPTSGSPPPVTPPPVTPPPVTPPTTPPEPEVRVTFTFPEFASDARIGGENLVLGVDLRPEQQVSWKLASGSPGELVAANGAYVQYVPPVSGASGTVTVTATIGSTSANYTFTLHAALSAGALTELVPAGGPLSDAQDVIADEQGNLLIADRERSVVLKLTPGGNVSVLAGQAGIKRRVDGDRATASFGMLNALAYAPDGTLYALDGLTVRKVNPDGSISNTVALNDPQDTIQGARSLMHLVFDSDGNLYLTERYSVRKLDTSGKLTTLAGQCDPLGSHDGEVVCKPGQSLDGAGAAARFVLPGDIAFDKDGNLLVTDGALRKVTRDGVVTTPVNTTGLKSLAYDTAGRLVAAKDNGVALLDVDSGSVQVLAGALGKRLVKVLPLKDGRYLLVMADRVLILKL